MRAALGVLCLQCVLLTGTTRASPVQGVPIVRRTAVVPAAKPPVTPGDAQPGTVPQPLSPQDLLFASPTTLDHIGRVVASVMIDGKGPYRFIIDTGANHSTISPQLATALGLRPSLQLAMHVTGVTGSEDVATVPIEKLQAGALVISDSRFRYSMRL
ncbi:MAG: retropepsin-like aspartic protease [Steroidobacteraceae bacterium]